MKGYLNLNHITFTPLYYKVYSSPWNKELGHYSHSFQVQQSTSPAGPFTRATVKWHPSVHISPQCSPNSITLSKRSQPSPACPSANSSIKIQTSNWMTLTGETEVLGEKLSQCHLVHHRPESHMDWTRKGLTHGTARPGQVKMIDVTRTDAKRIAYSSVYLLMLYKQCLFAACDARGTWQLTSRAENTVFVCDMTRHI